MKPAVTPFVGLSFVKLPGVCKQSCHVNDFLPLLGEIGIILDSRSYGPDKSRIAFLPSSRISIVVTKTASCASGR